MEATKVAYIDPDSLDGSKEHEELDDNGPHRNS